MHNLLLRIHPEFYETLSNYPLTPEYTRRLKELLPDQWRLRRDDIWVHAQSPDSERSTAPLIQGFKIHVSSTPIYALRALEIVIPLCVDAGIDFKIAGDPTLLYMLNSKQQSRGHSGKFMTIYPPDLSAFTNLIERLYQHTKGVAIDGPRILSDRQYKDSKILFYRYGGFRSLRRVNIDGTHTNFLVSPTGEWVPDERLPYFSLVDWVDDPFGRPSIAEPETDILLNNRYLIEEAFRFSNTGGIYHGSDTITGKPVVIKEARPLTNSSTVGDLEWDAVYFLRREYDMLTRLQNLDFVPHVMDLFEDAGHYFLVQERIFAARLREYLALNEVMLAPHIRRVGRIGKWTPKFKHIADTLIRMVSAVHKEGVLLGDLSPDNILINVESLQMWLIDFESAVQVNDDAKALQYATRWGTSGFRHSARAVRNELHAKDDWYAVAMILYSCVVPVCPLFDLNPGAEKIFLDKFIAMGVPIEVRAIIHALLHGAVQEAQETIALWTMQVQVSR
jgi:hypothetical protein